MARSITLSWDAVDGNVDGYNVYRGSLQGAESDIPLNGSQLVKDSKYVDETGDQHTVYFYKVSSVKDGRESNRSHEFRSPALPHSPKNVMAVEAGDSSQTPAGKAAQAHAAALIADAKAVDARKAADDAEAKAGQAKADADKADSDAASADANAANAGNLSAVGNPTGLPSLTPAQSDAQLASANTNSTTGISADSRSAQTASGSTGLNAQGFPL